MTMAGFAAAPLDHAAIARLVPHAGAMCLLDRTLEAGEAHLLCSARSHRDPANPLRGAGGLPATAAIEYAAQAMALHGALVAERQGAPSTPGLLASARGVRLHRLRLDDLAGELRIRVERQAGDARQILYAFRIEHDGACVAEGRAAVVLDPA